MSLSAHEQQELDLIEDEIAASDPTLASLLATFARLSADDELPAREQIRASRGRRGRRRPPGHGTFLRPGKPATDLSLVAVVLWLTVSVALLVSVLVISRGGGGKGCAVPGLTCAGQAPAHGVQTGTARLPEGQARDSPSLPGAP